MVKGRVPPSRPLPTSTTLPQRDDQEGLRKFLWWNEPLISDTLSALRKELTRKQQEMYDRNGWVNFPDYQSRDRIGRPNRWNDYNPRDHHNSGDRGTTRRDASQRQWKDVTSEEDKRLQDSAEKERGSLWDQAERESNKMWEDAQKEERKAWDDAEKQDRRLREDAERNERDKRV